MPGFAGRAAAPWIALVLFGAWPFVSFLAHNQDDAPLYWRGVAGYGLGFVALVAGVAALGGLLLRRAPFARIANPLGVGAALFFNYLALSGPLSDLGITLGTVKIAIWLALTLAVMAVVWRLSVYRETALVLSVMAGVMVAVPAAQLSLFAAQTREAGHGAPGAPAGGAGVGEWRPNVYWIVLDSYARADVLEAYFGFRNDGFVEELRARGFFVADRAYANYSSTKLSLSTVGAMDYYLPEGEALHPSLWTARLQGFNAVVDRFLARGYRYVHAEPGGNNLKTRCGGREAMCITATPRGALSLNEAEVGLMKLTPLYPVVRRLLPGFFSFDFTTLDEVVARLRPKRDAPFVLFAHIMSPHPPPRFNADCSRIERIEWDLVGESLGDAMGSYVTDVRCLNPEILRSVDVLLAADETDPIVIIQADHGYRLSLAGAAPGASDVVRPRLVPHAILHAMRLPARCGTSLDHDFTSVNTFRLVFACLGGENIEPLPNRLFAHGPEGIRPLDQ